MKGFTMFGVGCALFLAAQVSADTTQETLQNFNSCDGFNPFGCPAGSPSELVECFNSATLSTPYQLTEVSYNISSASLNTGSLSLDIYEWNGTGGPGVILHSIPLSLSDSSVGTHNLVLETPASLTTGDFCVGVSGDSAGDSLYLQTSFDSPTLPSLNGNSWASASACGVNDFLKIYDLAGFGNWCITATIAEEDVDTSIQVDIDIKFCSDPNAYNCKKNGVLPVTIFGTDGIDVADIDVSSLRLCLADLETCTGAPRDWSTSDRGDPLLDLGANMCALNPDTGLEEDFLSRDGLLDLDVSFEASEVNDTLLVDFCDQPKNNISPSLFIVGSTNAGDMIYSLQLDDVAVDQLVKKGR